MYNACYEVVHIPHTICNPTHAAISGFNGIAKVCAGGELVVMCTINNTALIWMVELINNQGRPTMHD